jgi:LmbE family N-acetylglucosaminyl deacetylase
VARTLVTFHAHPDDEAIATGGVMAKTAAQGDRVVLVVATRGEHASVGHDVLAQGETLAERRVAETARAAEILGVARVEFLGYVDSGMIGAPENDADGSFWSADIEEAAGRLGAILAEERAAAVTVYDDNGVYGHPDHIQVHRVGVRAAELAGTPLVYEATMNRDHIIRLLRARPEETARLPDAPDPEELSLGVSEDRITTAVDVRDYVELKRAAMAAHESQIPESSFFLQMPPEVFREAFGYEWFLRRGAPRGAHETDLFAPL